MRSSSATALGFSAMLLAAIGLFSAYSDGPTAEAQAKKAAPKKEVGPGSADLLKPTPRPKKAPLLESKLPLEFIKGERIALVGNSLAERMNLFGYFESMLHSRFPDKELVFRNFGRPADEVAIRQRSADYSKLDDPLHAFNPDTFLCFFGFNESYAGPNGVEKFKGDYAKFIDEFIGKYPRDDEKSPPRFILVTPAAFEPTGDKLLPDGKKENENLKLYADAVIDVAKKRNLAVIDLYTPTLPVFTKQPGTNYTINGAHLNEAGDREVATLLDKALFNSSSPAKLGTSEFEKIRTAVNDKSFINMQDHRMVNGWYVYGGRRTYDTDTFPREYVKLRNMAAVRDRYIWDMAQGKQVAAAVDDSKTGDLIVPPTRFGAAGRQYSENPELKYQTPDEFIKTCSVPPGMELKLFADEKMFPELAKPVQINFDNKGRLWVACMPSYPQWRPGDSYPNDKLLTFEDTDGDGKADKCTTFYDKLHCPTGFEFWNGGVLVVDQPRLLFLKDTDGDGRADLVVHLLDGWATGDTHHTCGAWEWSHGGLLHMLEGIATSTTLETPWGPHRSAGKGGAYVLDPRTMKIRQFALPGQANMWCYVFDEWGQGIVGDGTSANHHWDVPLSGAQYSGRKGLTTVFSQEGMRPALGNEWLVSRNLPDEVQKQFTYACVINMNGMPRFTIKDDGAGFKGERIKKDAKTPDDLIRSPDKHFRPADPQIGPDGALWFADWANALVGHMQYSQRDPNRDHVHGRIYRLVGKDKPLVKPATQFGKSIPEILEQFNEYEWRTRYRARRELRDRPTPEIQTALKTWTEKLDPAGKNYDRLLCEALWVQQSHHAVDVDLLKKSLASKTFEARAAAVHVLTDEREFIPGAFDLLAKSAVDAHPRVRVEALRGLSFYKDMPSIEAMLASGKMPGGDYWTKYALEAALSANEEVWRKPYLAGTLAKDDGAARQIFIDIMSASKVGAAVAPHLQVLLSQDKKSVEEKNKAMTAIADMKGNATNGRAIFTRSSCSACHKIGATMEQEYGPNLDKVVPRFTQAHPNVPTRLKLIESIIDVNADINEKYLTTVIETADGKVIRGLLVTEDKKNVVIFDGKDKRTIPVEDIENRRLVKQSSMPEGLAATMAPAEFLDLIEFLSTLK